MADEKKHYTIKEVAEVTGISETEIIKLVIMKKLIATREGKSVKIREDDLEDFLNEFISEEESEKVSEEPVLYTAEQVAKILKLSIDNIWNLLKTGELKGFKIREGRSSWRIPSGSLDEFIENRTKNSV